MRQTLTSLVLIGMLVAGFWPTPGMAEEPLEQEALSAIALSAEFGSYTPVVGLTDPRGVLEYPPFGFPCCYFIVEKSLNRVSIAPCCSGTPTPLATGLSTPTDVIAPGSGGTPFGQFLYVAESGANRISRIDNTGAVTLFASLPAPPRRLAFSDVGGGSDFGNFLFVTLANGEIRRIDSAGVVSPCASGFTSPEGLVFGPGGASRTTVLYVADATANTISKVNSACTVSPFAATGLTTPKGLAISQGLPYGPLDTTLYVVNAGTRVDRVDKSGNVTPFASGFTQADSVRFDSFVPVASRFGGILRISDAAVGTIVEVSVLRPFINFQLAGCNPCQAGQTFAITLTARNDGPIAVPVEVKTGFRLLDGTPLNFTPLLGNNKHFETSLPAGFNQSFLWFSIVWPSKDIAPPGRYCYQVSMFDPDLPVFNEVYSTGSVCFLSVP